MAADSIEPYILSLKTKKYAYNPTTKTFYWDPLNPPASVLALNGVWDTTTTIPTDGTNAYWTAVDGADVTKVKVITLEDFILDSANLFPDFIPIKVNGQPLWNPFSPPTKGSGATLAYKVYPTDYTLETNIPTNANSIPYWTSSDLVILMPVKRFFDMHYLYDLEHDDELYH